MEKNLRDILIVTLSEIIDSWWPTNLNSEFSWVRSSHHTEPILWNWILKTSTKYWDMDHSWNREELGENFYLDKYKWIRGTNAESNQLMIYWMSSSNVYYSPQTIYKHPLAGWWHRSLAFIIFSEFYSANEKAFMFWFSIPRIVFKESACTLFTLILIKIKVPAVLVK